MKNHNNKGSVLAVSLIIMGVMIVIALGISFSALQSRKSSIGSSKSNVAFQNADSGVEVVMQKIKNASAIADIDPASDLDGCNGIVNSSGKYKVELKKTDGTAVACGDSVSDIDTIKSTGYSDQDSRAIEVAVAAGGVTQIVAGNNVTLSPVGGTGVVTVNSIPDGGTKNMDGAYASAGVAAFAQTCTAGRVYTMHDSGRNVYNLCICRVTDQMACFPG